MDAVTGEHLFQQSLLWRQRSVACVNNAALRLGHEFDDGRERHPQPRVERDRGELWIECRRRRTLHVLNEKCLCWIVGQRQPVPPWGTGRILRECARCDRDCQGRIRSYKNGQSVTAAMREHSRLDLSDPAMAQQACRSRCPTRARRVHEQLDTAPGASSR